MENMIGKRIKKRRNELNITQTQIQQQTSISSGNLSCIENGKYLPSAIALLELSKILSCSIDWMLTGESSISDNSVLLDIEDDKEKQLLNDFRELPENDKDETLAFVKFKLDRAKKESKKKVNLNKETTSLIS